MFFFTLLSFFFCGYIYCKVVVPIKLFVHVFFSFVIDLSNLCVLFLKEEGDSVEISSFQCFILCICMFHNFTFFFIYQLICMPSINLFNMSGCSMFAVQIQYYHAQWENCNLVVNKLHL